MVLNWLLFSGKRTEHAFNKLAKKINTTLLPYFCNRMKVGEYIYIVHLHTFIVFYYIK